MWKQFEINYNKIKYQCDNITSDTHLIKILTDWGYNMQELNYRNVNVNIMWDNRRNFNTKN